jgi:hypothetical protein
MSSRSRWNTLPYAHPVSSREISKFGDHMDKVINFTVEAF